MISSFSQALPHRDTGTAKSQQTYEEFGACVFFILRISDRYSISSKDLGLDDKTLLRSLMDSHIEPVSTDDLDDDAARYLGDWIKALFETKTISGDLLLSCPVQNFYNMVPTIFQQTVLACHSNVIDVKTLKAGLDCTQIARQLFRQDA